MVSWKGGPVISIKRARAGKHLQRARSGKHCLIRITSVHCKYCSSNKKLERCSRNVEVVCLLQCEREEVLVNFPPSVLTQLETFCIFLMRCFQAFELKRWTCFSFYPELSSNMLQTALTACYPFSSRLISELPSYRCEILLYLILTPRQILSQSITSSCRFKVVISEENHDWALHLTGVQYFHIYYLLQNLSVTYSRLLPFNINLISWCFFSFSFFSVS